MKKIITIFSLTAMAGLGFLGYKNTKIDDLLNIDDGSEKTYIVSVAGDVTGDEEEKAIATKNRKEVLAKLDYVLGKDSYEVTYVYDTVFNGFAIKTTSSYADLLKETMNVSSVEESHIYAEPDEGSEGTASTAETIKQQKLANYSAETMSATLADVKAVLGTDSKGGEGITIGILDTGLYLNQVEGTSERATAEASKIGSKLNAPAFKALASGIATPLTQENIAGKGTKSGTYINNKIPFAYDYADNDNNVNPATENHGTHVASLAAANGDEFKGIAPNAQIVVMKVFGDSASGAGDDAIIAAVNDAVKLGLDEINMSLGTDLTDYDDDISDASYQALVAASNAGVIPNISAGNAGKLSFSSGSYSDYTTDTVEGGILGSYADYDETANIVASSNPDKAFYSSVMQVQKTGVATATAVSYSDQVKNSSTQTFTYERPLTDLLPYKEATGITGFEEGVTYFTRKVVAGTEESKNPKYIYTKIDDDAVFDASTTYYIQENTVTKEYVVVPGYGQTADYSDIDVTGKIAVVHRGNTTFVNKYQTAQLKGAIALVVINNDPSTTFNFSMDFNSNSPDIPVVFVFQNSTSAWGDAKATGSMTLLVNSVAEASDGNTVASYSSDGPSHNLDLGPTISAPGTSVIGAVDATASNAITSDTSTSGTSGLYGYENMSGTSMAAPNLSGAIALALGEKKASLTDEKFKEEKQKISLKAMATADQLVDGNGVVENSPRMQGAGRINVKSLLTADSYLTAGSSAKYGEGKVELKNTGDLYVKDGDFSKDTDADYIEFDYTIHNEDTVTKTYNASISVMIPELRIKETHDSYAAEELSSRMEEVGYNSSVTFNENDLSTYPTFVGTPTMSVRDDNLTNGYASMDSSANSSITVNAGSTATGKAKIRIDNLTVSKDWGDSKVTNYSGTLRDYISKYFSGSAGTFVEGFLKLEETSDESDLETLTMPYMGFYGDYSSADAVEPFSFEKEEAVVNGKYNTNAHIYNSDLANNFLQNLNDKYKKPNAYTGSTINATSTVLTTKQLENIHNFTESPLPNGSTYLSVTGSGDKSQHLYAGATGISDHLNVFFYVNRSCSEANWSITDSTGKSVKTGSIDTLMSYGTSVTHTSQFGLIKSWLTADTDGYDMDRGYAAIDLSSVKEGEYNLTFSFTLRGAQTSDTDTSNKVQTKTYPLTIDKTAPEYISSSIETRDDGSKYITVKAKDAEDIVRIGNVQKTGQEGTASYTNRIANSAITNDKLAITLTDYAHNKLVVLLHPSDLTFSVASTFFTDKYDYVITELDSSSHTYDVSLLDSTGDTIDPDKVKGSFYVYIELATGLSSSDIVVNVDSAETDDWTYDATTGILAIHFSSDSTSFSINQAPKGKDTAKDSSSSSSQNSSNTSNNTSNSTSSEEKKSGCGGSIIAATSSIASLGLLSLAIALKKKKENK